MVLAWEILVTDMKRLVYLLTLIALAAAPSSVQLPEGRYELGRRLRAFEATLAEHHAPEALQRAAPHLDEAVRDFFASRWTEAAAGLDQARLRLASAEPPAQAVRWAASLALTPDTFMLDTTSDEVGFGLVRFYDLSISPPPAVLEVQLESHSGQIAGEAEVRISELPLRDAVPLRTHEQGDYLLVSYIRLADQRIRLAEQKISLIATMKARLQRLRDGLRALPPEPRNTQRATLEDYVSTLTTLVHGGQMETNIPASHLLAEAEGLLDAEIKNRLYFGHGRPGEFWLTFAAPTGTVRARLMAPEAARLEKPLPLVIALHGVGGSENMFFDAYGEGKIVELCQQRQWLLVSPAATFFGLGLSAQKMIDAIAEMYSVDTKRVMVVGHSMGAGHAIRVSELLTETPLAVAALGGGGRVRQGNRLRNTAFFIGVGSEDFLLDNARALDKALRDAGITQIEFHEYPHVEHLAIVEMALGDVFAMFDRRMKQPP